MSDVEIFIAVGISLGLSFLFTILLDKNEVNIEFLIFFLTQFLSIFAWSELIDISYVALCLIAEFIIFYIRVFKKGG